jgi:hypothetical protein
LGSPFTVFGGALMCGEILGAVITPFLGFVEHCTVDIFRRSFGS